MTSLRWPKSVFRWEAEGKVEQPGLNLDPANKRQPPIWPHCWSVNGSLPISPLPLSFLCAPPWEASRQKCTLAELYSYKMLLTSDEGGRGGVGTFRVIKCSLDKHIHSRKSAIFISGRPLSDVSAVVTQYKGVLCPSWWGPYALSSLSQESLFSQENVGNQNCARSRQGCISGSGRQDSGRISNILNDLTICKQYTIHLLVWEGECIPYMRERRN